MTKMLLAVSEQWVADQRVDAIARWAQRMDADLLAVNVIFAADRAPAGKAPGEEILEQVAQRLKAVYPRVDTLLLFSDDVADAILKTAAEHQATIIVLGLSNKGVLARIIEGNIPQELIRNCKLPVLLLPPDWQGEI